MIEKIKNIFNKENLKNNIGIVLISIIVLVIIIGIIVYFSIIRNVSKIEVNKINEHTEEVINYIEDITLNKGNDLDKYILLALDYSYQVNNKNKLSNDEISEFLNNYFNKKITSEDIKNVGITSLLLEHNITYSEGNSEYILNVIPVTPKVIASNKIVYYKQDKIRKNNKKKYTVTYTKYVIEDPYKFLNYYLDNKPDVDYLPIRNYLTGTANISVVKYFIKEHEEDLKNYAKKDGKIKITYITKDGDKLLIDKIK